MAKTIKFNLICNDKSIRTIDDLQENFVIDDIIMYYRNGLLQRWLKVRGYESELESVNLINSTISDGEIIKELISVFNIEMDESKIKEGIYIWNFHKEREEQLNRYNKFKHSRNKTLYEYSKGYNDIINTILVNPDDAPLLKSKIREIISNYYWLFELKHREFFYRLLSAGHKLAILCLLMNEKARKLYLPIKTKDEKEQDILDINLLSQSSKDKKAMFDEIIKIIKELENNKNETLNGNIKRNDKISEDHWTTLKKKGKKYMILSLMDKDRIRSVGDINEYGISRIHGKDCCFDFSAAENKFLLCDGIEYQTMSTHSLYNPGPIYMEV